MKLKETHGPFLYEFATLPGVIFEETPAQMSNALMHYNRNCLLRGGNDLAELYAFAGIPESCYDKKEARKYGWQEYENEDGSTGLYYGFHLTYAVEPPTFLNHLSYSWKQTVQFVRLVWQSLGMLLRGEATVKDLSGPVGIVEVMAETGESSESTSDAIFNIAYLGAFIAVNLALMNMLPIPALDGGRVFLLLVTGLIELLTRKKLDPKYEGAIHATGMALLLALMAFVMINDVVRIFHHG